VTFTGFAAPQIAEFSNEPARQLMAALHDLIRPPPLAAALLVSTISLLRRGAGDEARTALECEIIPILSKADSLGIPKSPAT
jgi:hypothetical protein